MSWYPKEPKRALHKIFLYILAETNGVSMIEFESNQ